MRREDGLPFETATETKKQTSTPPACQAPSPTPIVAPQKLASTEKAQGEEIPAVATDLASPDETVILVVEAVRCRG